MSSTTYPKFSPITNRVSRELKHRGHQEKLLFQAAAHVAQSRVLIERYLRRSQSLWDASQLQSLSDGLHTLAFVLEKRSQKESR